MCSHVYLTSLNFPLPAARKKLPWPNLSLTCFAPSAGIPASSLTATFLIPATVNSDQYTIEIIDDSDPSNYNFSPYFSIQGATGTQTGLVATDTGSASASASGSSASSAAASSSSSGGASPSSAASSSASASSTNSPPSNNTITVTTTVSPTHRNTPNNGL